MSFYDQNAERFFNDTVAVDVSALRERFLAFLPKPARILDAGCGSGRDALAFLRSGNLVEAFDASANMAKLASNYTGLKVACCSFAEAEYSFKFDGIWACASLLHVRRAEIVTVLLHLQGLLVDGGYLYSSFKKGECETYRNERWFNDYTVEALRTLFLAETSFVPVDLWETDDVRPGRSDETWTNCIARKGTGRLT